MRWLTNIFMMATPGTSYKFLLQWHITAHCDQHCLHCYYGISEDAGRNDLQYEDCKTIIDDFDRMLKSWGIEGRINFTGGDPLLHPDWAKIMEYAAEKEIDIGILGNPNHLDSETIKFLKNLNLVYYQLSIDGMQEIHDYFRGDGHFQKTVNALHLLQENGIKTGVMFTLSKINKDSLIDVIHFVSEKGVNFFDFSRLVPVGSGEQFSNQSFTPEDYRDLLMKVANVYDEIQSSNPTTIFGRKDPLWALLYKELHKTPITRTDDDLIYTGCVAGNHLCILENGTVLPCRRLPIKIGKVPEQSLRRIFIESPILMDLRDFNKIEKCGGCNLVQYCRGCRGIAYATTGSLRGADPACWHCDTT